jgi:hypothetical protein
MSIHARGLAALTAVVASAAVALTLAPSASATTPVLLKVAYDANGTTHVAKPDSTMTLGPAVLRVNVRPNGSFSGSMALPPTTSSFDVVGLLPATATVSFVPAARLTGQITSGGGTTTITSTASYFIKLSDVAVAGVPSFVGSNCQTTDPVTIPVGGPFSINNGGTLTGTYSIGKFSHCGLTTSLINLLIPGDGNTVSLTLSNGRIRG